MQDFFYLLPNNYFEDFFYNTSYFITIYGISNFAQKQSNNRRNAITYFKLRDLPKSIVWYFVDSIFTRFPIKPKLVTELPRERKIRITITHGRGADSSYNKLVRDWIEV